MRTSRTMIGTLIRYRRRSLFMTGKRLAELCGFDPSHITRIEDGSRRPAPEHIVAIGRALKMPPADLAMALCEISPSAVREEERISLRAQVFRELASELVGLAHEIEGDDSGTSAGQAA